MKATIEHHGSTDTYTITLFNSLGYAIFRQWCNSIARCRKIALDYDANVTFIN